MKKHECNIYIDDIICANCRLCSIEEKAYPQWESSDTLLCPHLRIIENYRDYDFRRDFVGTEIDKEYYDAAVKRFETYKMQTKLQFAP